MSTLVVRWVHNSFIPSQVEGINLIHCQVQKNDVDEEVGRLQARQTVFCGARVGSTMVILQYTRRFSPIGEGKWLHRQRPQKEAQNWHGLCQFKGM